MDFIFGTLATDDLKLVHHRVLRRGVQHQHAMMPLDPRPGEAITLTVRVGQDVVADWMSVYYTIDGSMPKGSRGTASNGSTIELKLLDLMWDTLAWSYLAIWQGVLPGQPEGTAVRYQIGAWSQAGEGEIFADYPEFKATTERAAAAFFRGEALPEDVPPAFAKVDTFTFHVDQYEAPQWAKAAVIYQVFVDRFYPGEGREWLQPADLMGIYGGTLWGVRDKLDYIADLGITCIWLSPTFPSPTHHGYDITDYMRVEARMGGDEALHALVEAAHVRGMRVLLDLVCNHISHEHPYFAEAKANPTSPYRDWFMFDANDPIGYKTFFGVESMPFLNLDHPAARVWMLEIARYWLREFKIDGYRLDHANGPGPDFWADFRAACRAVNPESFIFGEVVESPDILHAYIGRLDGLLDFHVEDALRRTYAFDLMTEAELERFLERHYAYFPPDFVMPTFLDNHDMDRFLYAVKGDKAALRRAVAMQMRLPQPPIIYYGTEVGLSQNKGKNDGWGLEVSRLPMPWGDEQDQELLAFYKGLIAARKK
ncbi:MAG: alpha-amylase [Anaerolineae bacterium]|nr:alpha-amylase [Anaerolineae bacterium]